MNTWKVILATMVIFAAGLVTGGILARQLDSSRIARRPNLWKPAAQPFSPGVSRLEFLRRAQRELDLSGEQRGRVETILRDSQERSRKIMEPIAPQLRVEIQRAKEEFRAVLSAEQQKRFDELLQKGERLREPRRRPSVPAGGDVIGGPSRTNR